MITRFEMCKLVNANRRREKCEIEKECLGHRMLDCKITIMEGSVGILDCKLTINGRQCWICCTIESYYPTAFISDAVLTFFSSLSCTRICIQLIL